jgi:hypothetical protein
MLVREGGGFVLERDAGGSCILELHRVPIDEVEKHVRIVGTMMRNGRIDVEGVSLA